MPKSANQTPQVDTSGIDVLDPVWIELPDGCRLAARVWMPASASSIPVPAVLEYLPYRRRDGTAVRDSGTHPFFAANGYASLRVDIRGTGDSGGVYVDEYSAQEHADALVVIDWIARQSWCTGAVGMMGYSWGGFNGLQVAAMRPPALKAIITGYSTDDRYTDDCHYKGGAVVDDMLPWATTLLAIVATPRDPSTLDNSESGFMDEWKSRIDSIEPPAHFWLSHQTRDEYWQYGSVREDYSAIEAATLVIGGRADPYSNAALRLVENLSCPRRGIIGPWAHQFPHVASQGPRIDFLGECLKWWDYWLRGIDSGAMETPLLRAWVSEWDAPRAHGGTRSGRWVALDGWSQSPATDLFIGEQGLTAEQLSETSTVVVASREDNGFASGAWCANGNPGDLPPDQQVQDGMWECFDSVPLGEALEGFGFPRVAVEVGAKQRQANVCIRLCDVAPDGQSLLVSEGVLNLLELEDSAWEPSQIGGLKASVIVQLDAIAHRFESGHRIRLAISPNYFPRVWPVANTSTLTLHLNGESKLTIPTLPASASPWAFSPAPQALPGLTVEQLVPGRSYREVSHHFGTEEYGQLIAVGDAGIQLIEGRELNGFRSHDTFRIESDNPLSATIECERSYTIGRPERPMRVDVQSSLRADAESFHVQTSISAFVEETLVHTRILQKKIPKRTG